MASNDDYDGDQPFQQKTISRKRVSTPDNNFGINKDIASPYSSQLKRSRYGDESARRSIAELSIPNVPSRLAGRLGTSVSRNSF